MHQTNRFDTTVSKWLISARRLVLLSLRNLVVLTIILLPLLIGFLSGLVVTIALLIWSALREGFEFGRNLFNE
jgi:hypothetical protein